jgi:hypothetical protein
MPGGDIGSLANAEDGSALGSWQGEWLFGLGKGLGILEAAIHFEGDFELF